MKNNKINEPRDEEIEDAEEDIIEEIEDIEDVIEDIRNDIEILQKNDKYIFLVLIGMFAVLVILGISIVTNSLAGQIEPPSQTGQTEPAGTEQKTPTNQTIQQEPEEETKQEEAAGFDGKDYYKGPKDAKVTIIEYTDYECPYCSRHALNTIPSIIKDYVETEKVKYIVRDFPLGFHANAQKAAEATECAGEQTPEKFWEMHDKLFETKQLDITSLKKHASDIGLDVNKFNECLDSGKYADEVKQDLSEGQTAGVSGTPSSVINGQLVVGAQPYDNFKNIIDNMLSTTV